VNTQGRKVTIRCKGCSESIECEIVQNGRGNRIDFAAVRLHHRTTGHKVDGTKTKRRAA
jgi:hypothetical protein